MKLVCFLLSLILCFPVTASAAEPERYTPEISHGIAVLRQRYQMRRGAMSGSRIQFEKSDFTEVFGEVDFEGIRIVSLPEQSAGRLVLDGLEVTVGQVIAKKDLSKLVFLPSETDSQSTSFVFSGTEDELPRSCQLIYGEKTASAPLGEALRITTHKNVASFFEIETESALESCSIEITRPCKNGVLEQNYKGKFVYRPDTDFTGSDRFTYRVTDEYGNRSGEITAKIRVIQAENNLYFYDLTEKESHNSALFACSKGYLSYEVDDQGLPVFEPEESVSYSEFWHTLRLIHSEEAEEAMSVLSTEAISEGEAQEIFRYWFQYDHENARDVFGGEDGSGNLTRETFANMLYSVVGS